MLEEQTSTDLSCLNPQIQAMIDNDDRTYKGINMSLQGNCCPPPKLMHTKISNIRSRRCKARQIIIALKSTWLSPSPLKTTITKETNTCMEKTIYYKVYLLMSVIINPGGVSSFKMHFLQMSCKIIFIIIVWLQKISIPPFPTEDSLICTTPTPPRIFLSKGIFDDPPFPRNFQNF